MDGPRPPGLDEPTPSTPPVTVTESGYTVGAVFEGFLDINACLTLTDPEPPQDLIYDVEIHAQKDGGGPVVVGNYTIAVLKNVGSGYGCGSVTATRPGGWFVYQVVKQTTLGVTRTVCVTAGQYIPEPTQ